MEKRERRGLRRKKKRKKEERKSERRERHGLEKKKERRKREKKETQREERKKNEFFLITFVIVSFQIWNVTIHPGQIVHLM